MADLWYVKVDAQGIVYHVFCDDWQKPIEEDIPLDPAWYYGQSPGINISDIGHPKKYKVKDGRLVPTHDVSAELERAKAKKLEWVDDYAGSPILSQKKKEKLAEADYEAYLHLQAAINENEVIHTRKKGY